MCARLRLEETRDGPQSAPLKKQAMTIRRQMERSGEPGHQIPTAAPRMAPTFIWPSAPMLNRPALNPRATESPTKISGVAVTMVSDSG